MSALLFMSCWRKWLRWEVTEVLMMYPERIHREAGLMTRIWLRVVCLEINPSRKVGSVTGREESQQRVHLRASYHCRPPGLSPAGTLRESRERTSKLSQLSVPEASTFIHQLTPHLCLRTTLWNINSRHFQLVLYMGQEKDWHKVQVFVMSKLLTLQVKAGTREVGQP